MSSRPHPALVVAGYLGLVVTSLVLAFFSVAIHPAVGYAAICGFWFMAIGFRKPYVFLLVFVGVLLARPAEFFPFLSNLHPAKFAALLALGAFVFDRMFRRNFQIVTVRQNAWMGALTVAALLSGVLGSSASMSIAFFQDVFVKIIIIYFLMVNLIVAPKQAQVFMWTLVAIGSFLSVFVQVRANMGIGLVEGSRVILVGLLGDPNDLAVVFLLSAPFLMASVMENKGIGRLFSVVFVVLVVGGILATQSRGGLLGLVAGAGLLLNKKVANKLVVAGAVALLVVGLVAASGISSRAVGGSFDEGLDDSAATRLTAWDAGMRMFVHKPVLGIGLNQFPEHYLDFAIDPPVYQGFDAHNTYIKALAETGIVGFIPFAMLLWLTLKGAWRLNKLSDTMENNSKRALLMSVFPMVVALFTASFFLSHSWNWFIYIVFALVASLSNMYNEELRLANEI